MHNNATKRIALNSMSLYANMVVTMIVTLIGTRFALQALGNEEYAVYALVANIVALFSFLNVAMASATQRFLSYTLGSENQERTKDVFYTCAIVHSVIAILTATIILTLGIPAITYWLEIPQHLHSEGIIVLITIVCCAVFTIFSALYEAVMTAHEDIYVIAIINIVEASCKLGAAIGILFIDDNKLVTYSTLMMLAFVLSYLCKRFYSKRNYVETNIRNRRVYDLQLLKRITQFAGWNLIGNGCSIVRYQAVSIILNLFYKLTYNAGYGIAQQFNGFLLFFSNSMVRPIRPQLIKNEGAGQHDLMIKYSMSASRFTTLMLACIAIPLYINLPFVLESWLDKVPSGAILFCQGFLIVTIINQLTVGQQMALESVGIIKRQHIILGTMHLIPLVVSIILLHFHYPYYYIIYCIILEEILNIGIRTLIAKKDAGAPIGKFVKEMLIPCVLTVMISYIITSQIVVAINVPIVKLFVSTIVSFISITLCASTFCLKSWEKEKLKGLMINLKSKFFRR